jgi:hypothetical protein
MRILSRARQRAQVINTHWVAKSPFSFQQHSPKDELRANSIPVPKLYDFIEFLMLDQYVLPSIVRQPPNHCSYFAPSAVVTRALVKVTCVHGERSMKAAIMARV